MAGRREERSLDVASLRAPPAKHRNTTRTVLAAMPESFEPLKNDLLLRAARGTLLLPNCCSDWIANAETGERVERPPMWVMRQGD